MNYKKAYYHIFNRMTDIIAAIQTVKSPQEQINVALLLQQLQAEGEEICVASDALSIPRAARHGSSL